MDITDEQWAIVAPYIIHRLRPISGDTNQFHYDVVFCKISRFLSATVNLRSSKEDAMGQIHKRFTDERVRLLMQCYDQGQLSREEAQELLGISENTVKGHVSNILSKLHLADRTHAPVYAWQQGIGRR